MPSRKTAAGRKTMLVNAMDPEEIRVAVLSGGALDELYVQTRSRRPAVGNIYNGRVSNYENSLDAAFVDLGVGKHGFLRASDVGLDDEATRPSRSQAGRDERLARVRELLRPGSEITVQVKKEAVGGKGPALTTFIGLPGRYLVLMPSLRRVGVSRRITDPAARESLKRILADIDPPKGLGFVIRTEASGQSEQELRRDVDELLARWNAVNEAARAAPAPALLWEEADLTLRALRDYLASDTYEIWIDSPKVYDRALEFISENVPGLSRACRRYESSEPMFSHFGIEEQLASLMEREVRLPGGGTLLIERTEAVAAVDVNTGRTRHRRDGASMILKTNIEAAREVARQLRLRDIGGLVVIDFIDMETQADRDAVEAELRRALEQDKARTTVIPISALGVLEMTRQRRRRDLGGHTTETCPYCRGRGVVRSIESLAVAFLRELRSRIGDGSWRVSARFHPDRALAVGNVLRPEIARLEAERGVHVETGVDPDLAPGQFAMEAEPCEPPQPTSGEEPGARAPAVFAAAVVHSTLSAASPDAADGAGEAVDAPRRRRRGRRRGRSRGAKKRQSP